MFVRSTARAHAAATARAKKLDRARDDLQRLQRGLGSRHYPDEKAVTVRITAIASARRVGAYLRTETGTDPPPANPPCAGGSTKSPRLVRAADQPGPPTSTRPRSRAATKARKSVERRYGTIKARFQSDEPEMILPNGASQRDHSRSASDLDTLVFPGQEHFYSSTNTQGP